MACRANKQKKLRRVELSFAQKNKWGEDWTHYWFYVKVGRPDPLSPESTIYPFACGVEDLDVTYAPDYDGKPAAFKACCDAFYLATTTLSGRDVIEEALAVGILPLSRGWAPLRMESKVFPSCQKELPYPRFDLVRPEDRNDESLNIILGCILRKSLRLRRRFCDTRVASTDPSTRWVYLWNPGLNLLKESNDTESLVTLVLRFPRRKSRKPRLLRARLASLKRLSRARRWPNLQKKVHIYKPFESDQIYLDDQLDSQQALVMGSQLPPSSYLTAENIGLPSDGQGSGLDARQKNAEAAIGLIELGTSGAEGHETAELKDRAAGAASPSAPEPATEVPLDSHTSHSGIKISDFSFAHPHGPSSTEREYMFLVVKVEGLISRLLLLTFCFLYSVCDIELQRELTGPLGQVRLPSFYPLLA